MSLVGPRPELRRYVRRFADEFRDILTVRPGLTDLASITYRHESDWLAGAPDLEAAYVRQVLPDKLRLGRDHGRDAPVGYEPWVIVCPPPGLVPIGRGSGRGK